ncbi:lytic transglycosylase domain-containing protein [Rhodoferax sp.]|uniref:lytic transglycosylase domain-containing protein n=1 Tax=Rhodoferax sp. TaxID=50421 RepID=UPI001EBCA3E2|nr:lytic transglycosylase domain-containing protein [Rhodoferax sp.]MBT9505887.1 lytic transglycosylase domain-containing protein [Rhodoferax sp.]
MQFHTILTSIALLGCLSLSSTLPVHAQGKGASRAQADDAILEMGQAFKQGDRKRLTVLLPRVSGHPLEPWGAYWELRARLGAAAPSEVQDFLKRYAGTYQEDRLRNDWLLLLGQRRDWTALAAELPNYRMNDDREVRCYALALEPAVTGIDLAAEVKRQWYAQKDADDGCAYAAAHFYEAKKLTDTDIWRKARLAMEHNRPKVARAATDILSPAAGANIEEIISSPARFLSKRVVAAGRVAKESVLMALIRLGSTDPDMAASVLENHWSVHLTSEQRSWAWGVIGKHAAQRLSNDAMEHFAKARDAELNDDHLGWKVRAALRQGKWKEVLGATKAMSAEAAQDSTWIYWRARALLQLAKSETDRAEALRLLESIAGVRGFYEQLALEELGQRISAPARPAPPSAEEKEAVRLNAGLQRGLYAIQIGLRTDGVREWNYSTNLHQRGGMSDRELLAAADLACQREVWDRCINASDRTKTLIDFEQRFPMPHKDAVVQRATQIGLDPAYVYGLIRQESRFIMDARSGVGASGLMQVMPPTARWTAKKIGLTNFKPHQITERDTNIAIGTGYLKLVLDDFAGSMPMAAAAYNAGPSRPRNWRGQTGAPVLEAAIWAENVPFTETRDYVKKVLSNTTNYAALISGQPQSLKSRLGMVGPREVNAPESNNDLP